MKIKVKNPVFGVPITFLDKHCPAQFNIVSFRKGEDGSEKIFYQEDENQINSTIIGGGGEYYYKWSNEQSQRYRSEWEEYLRQNPDKADMEPIDLFFPGTTKRTPGTLNGFIRGVETYRRILIQKRDEHK